MKIGVDCARCCDSVFLMDKPWNGGREAKGAVRVKNWDEILKKLGAAK